MGIELADQAQNTGKASRKDYRGMGTGRMVLELAEVEERHCFVQVDSSRRCWVGRHNYHQMIQVEEDRSAVQESSARSSFPSGREAGKLPRDEGRHSGEWAKMTIVQWVEGTWVIGVVREQRRGALTRHSVVVQVDHAHSQTSVGKGTGLAVLHLELAHLR